MRGLYIFLGGVLLSILLVLWILWDGARPPLPAPAARPVARSVPKLLPVAPAPAAPDAAVALAPVTGIPGPPSGDRFYPMLKMDRARPALVAHDPQLWVVLRRERNRMAYLSHARPVRECIKTFMTRKGYQDWSFGGVTRLQLHVAAGLISFPYVELSEHGVTGIVDRPPDNEFLSCYQRAVASFRIKCPECKQGNLEISWKLRTVDYFPGNDGLDGRREPDTTDTKFYLAGPGGH